MRSFSILTLIFISVSALAQKFMVIGKDTLPYKSKWEIQKDTLHLGSNTYYPGDTMFYGRSGQTFERIRGKIVNKTDSMGMRQGTWVITDEDGSYREGNYNNGKSDEHWKEFDSKGNLLGEKEYVNLLKDSYIVRQVNYTGTQATVVINKPFLRFYINNFFIVMATLLGTFIIRIFINSSIYNIENGTDYSPIYSILQYSSLTITNTVY